MDNSDSELINKILRLREEGLGYRRIGRTLEPSLSKDTVRRICLKHQSIDKSTIEPEPAESEDIADEELLELKRIEKEAETRSALEKKKAETRKRIKDLMVLATSQSFETRHEIFENPVKMLDFAQKVIPVRNPKLWKEFNKYCKEKQWNLQKHWSMPWAILRTTLRSLRRSVIVKGNNIFWTTTL